VIDSYFCPGRLQSAFPAIMRGSTTPAQDRVAER
jgi:hypothetical protein